MEHYKYFENRECEYYPCHKVAEGQSFNCLFCYCPLYALKENCGGKFTYLDNGIKDCSNCLIPHSDGGYDYIMGKMREVIEVAKKR